MRPSVRGTDGEGVVVEGRAAPAQRIIIVVMQIHSLVPEQALPLVPNKRTCSFLLLDGYDVVSAGVLLQACVQRLHVSSFPTFMLLYPILAACSWIKETFLI